MVLPSLTGLRAFEAAARHMSFTRAAAELNVTQTAISHQIRRLEEQLGLPLFMTMMRPAAGLRPATAKHAPVLRDDHAADRRIRRRPPQPARRERQSMAHVLKVTHHVTPVSWPATAGHPVGFCILSADR